MSSINFTTDSSSISTDNSTDSTDNSTDSTGAYNESLSSDTNLNDTCDSVLVIPFIRKNNNIYFITVLDKQNKEWTFISGTVDKNEKCDDAVIRELKEETKNCIDIVLTNWNHKTFQTSYLIRNKIRIYKVYMIDITNSKLSTLIQYRKKIGNCFSTNTLTHKKYNENIDIDIDTLKTFQNKKKWSFMIQILNHHEFIKNIKDILK